eukprot:349182_1
MASTFQKIDDALKRYYESLDKTNYFDVEDGDGETGKFIAFCEDNGLEEDDLEDELVGEAKDCMYLEFDEEFPFQFPDKMKDKSDTEKQAEIFKILKHCFKFGEAPTKM